MTNSQLVNGMKFYSVAALFSLSLISSPPQANELNDNATLASKLQTLLEKYEALFFTPIVLPSQHEVDHRIPLHLGATSINVRPYRYLYFQKEEIKNMV